MLLENLKNEYEFRYRRMLYEKLHRNYLLNRFEKNNYNIIYKAIEDLYVHINNQKKYI